MKRYALHDDRYDSAQMEEEADGYYVTYDDHAAAIATRDRRIASLERALRRIAYEPQGEAIATAAYVLDSVTEIARDALLPTPSPTSAGER